ncbi:MAG: hypothetical protein OQL06_09445 [Gammaproteobacteria bacterium]|nr:hypothetical protein [Gammaproteobacteria bacterium]
MPLLDANTEYVLPGITLAVAAESLFLANLLILPLISFLMLIYLNIKNRATEDSTGLCHLRQTMLASIWGGILIVLVTLGIILMGGFDNGWTWVVVITYFTTIHATFVLLGALGLAKAMANKHYHYPLISFVCSDIKNYQK